MGSDGDALLASVCENPWDDTPRLVYADWLDENGDPERAAFIRFECEYPNWSHSHPEYPKLSEFKRRLDESHPKWRARLPVLAGVRWDGVFFERGFVVGVTFRSAKAFASHAASAFAATPVQDLDVGQLTNRTIGAVAGSPFLRRLRHLLLRGNYGGAGVRRLAESPHLGQLKSLSLWGACGDDAAEAIAACPTLGELMTLGFSNHTLTDRGVMALIESECLRTVRYLILHNPRGLSDRVEARLRERFAPLP